MSEKQSRTIQKYSVIATATLVLAMAVFAYTRTASAAWTEPTAPPPGGNVAAPLNASSVAQTKTGPLSVEGVFTALGGIQASVGTGDFVIQATSPNADTGTTTAGVLGRGQAAGSLASSAGVYGISYATPTNGTHIGLLGVAGANTSNSFGIYGWNNNFDQAYAGYFVGKTTVVGDLTATRFCLGVTCVSSWGDIGGGPGEASQLTENPENNTYFTNTDTNLAIGGNSDSNAAFFFSVTPSSTRGTFFAEKSIIIGEPNGAIAGDGICSDGETCSPTNEDCWGRQDSCGAGTYCDPVGSGVCINSDITAPTAPGNLRVNGSTGATIVPLVWDASTDVGGSGVAGYRIYRCEGVGCTPTALLIDTGTTATVYTDTGVSPDTTYNYEAKAYDGSSNVSSASNRLQAVTPPQGDFDPPSVPQNLRLNGTATDMLVPLAWDASTDTGDSGLLGYKLYRCSGLGCTPTLYQILGLATTYDDTVVSPLTTYTYRVSAYDGDGNESAQSTSLVVATPADTSPPSIDPSPPTVATSSSGAVIRFTTNEPSTSNLNYRQGSADPNPNTDPWVPTCTGAPGCDLTADTVNHEFSISGLTPSTSYSYKLYLKDASGNLFISIRFGFTTRATGGGKNPNEGDNGGEGGGGAFLGQQRSIAQEPTSLPTSTLPLSRLLSVPTAKAFGPFEIPAVLAAAPFEGSTPVRLTVHGGVIQLIDGTTTMELGNEGSDIASSSDIVIKPGSLAGANGAVFSKKAGANATNLVLGGKVDASEYCISGANCITSWPTGGGGGVVTNADQVIWNTQAGTPLGSPPQPATFNISGSGSLGGGLTVSSTTLVVLPAPNSRVGIGTAAPNAAYKLDVVGDVNTSGTYFQGGVAGNTSSPACSGNNVVVGDLTVRGGIVTGVACEADDGGAGGGGVGGGGTANYIPKWVDGTTLTDSVVYDNGSQILVGTTTPLYAQAKASFKGGPIAIDRENNGNWIRGWGNGAEQLNIGSDGADSRVIIIGNVQGGAGNDAGLKFFLNGATRARFRQNGDFQLGGTQLDNLAGGPGTSGNPEICLNDSCVDSWSELILNTANFGVASQTGGFWVTGDGRVGQTLTVDTTLQTPTANRTTLDNEFRQGGVFNNYNISSQYRFGGTNSPVQGLGFFEDDSDNVIAVITEDRKLHLGYDAGTAAGATQLCFYGQANGDAQCVDDLSDFGGGGGVVTNTDQVIWNTQAGSPLGSPPQPATFNISGSGTIGTRLTVATSSLDVIGNAVGIGIAPSGTYRLEVSGNTLLNGTVRGNQSGALRVDTGNGYIDIGPKNGSYAHIETDLTRFYFNKDIWNDGAFSSYSNDNLVLQTGGTTRLTVLGNNAGSPGFVGIGTTTPARALDVALAGGVRLAPSALPGTPAAGDIAIDSGAANTLKWYNGSGWQSAGGSGGVVTNTDQVIWNAQAGTPLGGFPQPATINIAGSATINTNLTVASTLLVATAAKVGIGTATPDQKLTISGGYGTTGLTTDATDLNFGTSGGSPNAAQVIWGDNTGWKLHFGTRTNTNTFQERLTLVDTGNVGIGTVNPSERLFVVTPDEDNAGLGTNRYGVGILDQDGGTGVQKGLGFLRGSSLLVAGIEPNIVAGGGAHLDFFTSDVDNTLIQRLRITDLGNVGIGTTTPSQKLHVNGISQLGEVNQGINGGIAIPTNNAFVNFRQSSAVGETNNDTTGWEFTLSSGANRNIYLYNSNVTNTLGLIVEGAVGIGNVTPVSRLAVNNNQAGSGSATDAIAAYANNTTGSALYAQQNNAGANAWAGYFSGKVNITTTLSVATSATIGGITYDANTRFVQCPPKKVYVDESSSGRDEWLTYDTCTIQNASTVRITLPQVCDGAIDAVSCFDLSIGSPVQRTPEAVCWEYGLVYVAHTTGANTGAYLLAEPPTVPRPHVWNDPAPPGGTGVRVQTADCGIGNPPQAPRT